MKPADVQNFHNDLRAAVIAQAPVEIGSGSLGRQRLSLAKIDQLEQDLQGALPSQSDASSETNSWNLPESVRQQFPCRYLAGLKFFNTTGAMTAVLDGMSVQRMAIQQVSRVLRRAFIYLGLLLVAAVCGLYLLGTRLVPRIDDLRADIAHSLNELAPERMDAMSGVPIFIGVIVFGLLAMLLWACFGGVGQLAIWLGGRHYIRCQVLSTAMESIRLLVQSGVEPETAVDLSCDLTAADTEARTELMSVVQESSNDQEITTRCNFFRMAARARLEHLRATLPATLTCLIGGLVVLFYCLSVFLPILHLLRDLTQVGI